MSRKHSVQENHIIMEMLEIFINAILYAREIYPAAIFRQRKMYNSAIYVSIYPALNDYITRALKSALHLLNSKHLYRLQLVIFDNDQQYPAVPIERFVFDFWPLAGGEDQKAGIAAMDDEYLVEFEEEARKKLLQLDKKLKQLRPLRDQNTTFKFLLETTQTAHIEMTSNPKMQEFLWMSSDDSKETACQTILPVTSMKPFTINVYTSY